MNQNDCVLLLKPEIIDEIIVAIDNLNKDGYYFSYKRTEDGENSRLCVYASHPEDFLTLGMITQPIFAKHHKKTTNDKDDRQRPG
jgi:hypothetical protein